MTAASPTQETGPALSPDAAAAPGPVASGRRLLATWTLLAPLLGLLAASSAPASWPDGVIENLVPHEDGDVIALVREAVPDSRQWWLVRADPNLRVVWRSRLDGPPHGYSCTATIGSGVIALVHREAPSREERLRVHDLETGEMLWATTPSQDEDILTSGWPSIRGGLALHYETGFKSEFKDLKYQTITHVTARDARTGQTRWQSQITGNIQDYRDQSDSLQVAVPGRLTTLSLVDGTRENHERPRGLSQCRDGDRLYIASDNEIVRMSPEPGAAPDRAWALPPRLTGAWIARCGRYGNTTMLTFVREDSRFHRAPPRASDDDVNHLIPRSLRDPMTLALVLIDDEVGRVEGIVNLTHAPGGESERRLSDGCARFAATQARPPDSAPRCALDGDLTRYVPIMTVATREGRLRGVEPLLLDLETRSFRRMVEDPKKTHFPFAVHRVGDDYLIQRSGEVGFLRVDGTSGETTVFSDGLENTRSFPYASLSTSGETAWLRRDRSILAFDLATETTLGQVRRGFAPLRAKRVDDWTPFDAQFEPASSWAEDITPLYSTRSSGTPAGADPRLGAWIRVGPGGHVSPNGREAVAVTIPFLMMTMDVTIAQWVPLMGRRYCEGHWTGCEEPGCAVHPLSREAMFTFANRASERLGLEPCYQPDRPDQIVGPLDCDGLRLPTSAEWAVAAGAGRDDVDACDGDPACLEALPVCQDTDGRGPVGMSPPNRLGLHDIGAGSALRPRILGDRRSDERRPRAVDPVVRSGFDWAASGGSECGGSFINRTTSTDCLPFRLVRTVKGD